MILAEWTSSRDYNTRVATPRAEDPPAYPYLARGRRLAELSRSDQAEADFNQAVTLQPDDIEVRLARAVFYAERGNDARAQNEFRTALDRANAAPAPDCFALARRIENELGRRDAVIDHWQSQADHAFLWRIRAQRQIELGNWKAAAKLMEHGEHWSHDYLLAPLHCLRGDVEGFRKICLGQEKRFPSEWDQATRDYHRMDVLSLGPTSAEQAAELTRLLESRLREFPNWRLAPLGAGLYRNNRYDEALRVLNECLNSHVQWQKDARVWPLLAMTHWQLGHHDEARKWLAKSAWRIDFSRRAATVPGEYGPQDTDYADLLRALVFYAEAKSLVREPEDTPTPDP